LFVLNSELMLMDHQVLLLSLFACILSICNPILSLSLDVPAWPPSDDIDIRSFHFGIYLLFFFRKLPTDGCSFHMSKMKVID